MDDALRELVSRAVDDDLDVAETAELAARAADDPELAAELESTHRLRQAVARLADAMAPPPALDAVVEPLRRGRAAAPPRVRPAVRWLGLAAALILGATVALEVVRRQPAPVTGGERAPRARSVDDEAVFELAPLPTANPGEPRPFGASDRLLAEEPPVPEPPEPEPLEVLGPLPLDAATPELAATAPAGAGTGSRPEAAAQERPSRGFAQRTDPDTVGNLAAAPQKEAGAGGEDALRSAPRSAPKARAPARADHDRPVEPSLAVAVTVTGREVWSGRATGCRAGRTAAVIEVLGGVVVAVEPASGGELCRPETLLGTRVEGLEDGRHTARIVVEAEP